ncbi:hypothetical protein Vretimale_3738 [Volvox reticuliferus]|uniref:SAND domain-containing protein n=1 Tax=Volvox reticuliferus TaxID=1737510 RepID=A0A8J4DCC9_9CHLO|nr:hypothetical protein Vretimale_3738 [Volvox reticuliferus]
MQSHRQKSKQNCLKLLSNRTKIYKHCHSRVASHLGRRSRSTKLLTLNAEGGQFLVLKRRSVAITKVSPRVARRRSSSLHSDRTTREHLPIHLRASRAVTCELKYASDDDACLSVECYPGSIAYFSRLSMSSYGGNSYPGRGQRGSYGTGPASGRATGTGRKPVAFCTCCEAKLSPDELLMSSQTEGRCVACQQFVEAQSACRVCHLPWSSSNETQLVPCDACGFYMHDNCVKKGALQAKLNVSCNDVAGTFIMDGIKVLCHCKECRELPKSQREFHPTHWEQHCGAGTAKKWKASVKIEPGGAPEVPPGGNPMQIGKWFDMLGVEFRPAKTTGGPPVLDFTGATIRRMEAEGAAAGAGSGGGPQPQQQASQPPEQQQQQQPQQQQRPSPPASSSPSPMYQQVLLQQPQPPLAAPLPPRPARGMQSMQSASGSIPPLGGGGGRRGGGGGGDDVVTSAANSGPAGGAGAKPPRPVSDEREGNGDAVYCRVASTRVATQPRRGGGRDGGEEGESSSRGSASDTLGHTATA